MMSSGEGHTIRHFASRAQMQAVVSGWLLDAPLCNTIQLGALENGSELAEGDIACAVLGPDGRLAGTALRQGSVFPMSVSPLGEAAARALAEELAAGGARLPERLVGRLPGVEALAEALYGPGGWQREHTLLTYSLGDEPPPPPALPEGCRLHWAESTDREMVIDWCINFAHDTGLPPAEWDRKLVESRVHKRLTGQALMFLLDVDSQPLSMAGHNRCGPGISRIGGVYTPADKRGQGLSTLTVSHLCQHLRAAGTQIICLFADADNPVSNRLYQRIGFAHVGDQATIRRI